MKFDQLMRLTRGEPVFESALLLAGDSRPENIRLQLSRWVKAGRLLQLRRGLYALAPAYQTSTPNPFLVANRLVSGSYVSLQSALAYYAMIPEYVPEITSVTTGRPGMIENQLGRFSYRHIPTARFHGYRVIEPGPIFIACPEKALLDLISLTPGADDAGYLVELRLQNLARMDAPRLARLAGDNPKPKIQRVLRQISGWIEAEKLEEAK